MNNCDHSPPCEPLKELQKEVEKHCDELAKGSTSFAVINTKLNALIAALSIIGIAVCSVMVQYAFK